MKDEYDKILMRTSATKDAEISALKVKKSGITRGQQTATKDAESYKRKWKEAESTMADERRKIQDGTETDFHNYEPNREEKEQARKLRETLEEKIEDHEIVKEKLNCTDAELSYTKKKFNEHRKKASEKEKRFGITATRK